MKDKLKSGGDAVKTLIKTGGDVAEKVIDKGADVANAMMNQTTGMISKLSDDIGAMADRILATEEQIGSMADRIVKTEELMAGLTATLAGKGMELPSLQRTEKEAPPAVVLGVETTKASGTRGPRLVISGEPRKYLLYVSASPLFQEGSTVISKVGNAKEFDAAWKRGIRAIAELAREIHRDDAGAITVSVAVKAITKDNQLSPLSNSIDVRLQD